MLDQRALFIESAIQIALIALLALWCFQIASPFINLILWGGIIAIGVYPLYLWLQNKTGMSTGWTATLLTLVLLSIFVTPTVILSGALIDNAHTLSTHLENDQIKIPPPMEGVDKWPIIGSKLEVFWLEASQDPKAAFGRYETQLRDIARWVLTTTAGVGLGLLSSFFSIIIAGVFLASAQGAKEAIVAILTRLSGNQGAELTELSMATVKSVVTGILGIALIQSILAGLGFIVMGIPAAGLLAFICLIMAVVQIDILLVLIPLSIYGFSVADTGPALMFLIWNIVVGLANNVLKPILLAKGVDVPMAIIFIGAIGGMLLTGIIGLFVGAVIMVLGYSLFMNWLKIEIITKD